MARKKQKPNNFKAARNLFLVFFVIIIMLFAKYCYIALSPEINGRNMKIFAQNRNTISKVLKAKRGTIFDSEGNILANNVTSYSDLIACKCKKNYTLNVYKLDIFWLNCMLEPLCLF